MGASNFRLLNMVRPFLLFLPEVQSANRKVTLREKVLYNVLALFIFLVCSQLPLYGIQSITATDPFYWMRIILASNRGTVMELGINTDHNIRLCNAIACWLKNHSKMEHKNYCSMLIAIGEAVAYVYSGMYGSVDQIGIGNSILIIFQLFFASLIVISLDELLQRAFSPVTISSSGRGVEFEGAVIALFHQLLTRTDKANLPNVTNLLSTIMIFLVVVYFQGFRVLLRVRSKNARGQQGSYPIKLFYTSNMPIILQSALVSNIYFISQLLYKRFSGNFLVNLLGIWKESEQYSGSGDFIAVNPIHASFYIVFILSICAILSKLWIQVSGSTARDVAKQLKNNK
ncbi:hypothetical protein F8388_022104 [Cannabis sativa]|uniref:Translocon Sec61/SecY plug domain-containing protein n=1 Tax=Cannabis sativa TaxID=3483 RepID=A0A7J6G835_CANSA|nr:hypothetical protein F8388_022104 [Cannabis sativa]